jgi:hypothetical protein
MYYIVPSHAVEYFVYILFVILIAPACSRCKNCVRETRLHRKEVRMIQSFALESSATKC